MLRGQSRLERRRHAGRDVFDRHQNIELEIGCARFVHLCFRVESVADIIVFLAAEFLERIEADVMVRNDEAVRGNE